MNLFHTVGRYGIRIGRLTFSLMMFLYECFYMIFLPSSYSKATKAVIYKQIYFTAVQILPMLIPLWIILGSALIGVTVSLLTQLGMLNYFGNAMVGILITEIAPLFSVFFIALRSSSAMNAEIAVMKVNGELKTLHAFGIDFRHYLVVPRVLGAIVSLIILTFLFSIITAIGGIIISAVSFGLSFDNAINGIMMSVDFTHIISMCIKSLIFGFLVAAIPIYAGLQVSEEFTAVPIAVLHGMVILFSGIVVIEGFSLIIKFI